MAKKSVSKQSVSKTSVNDRYKSYFWGKARKNKCGKKSKLRIDIDKVGKAHVVVATASSIQEHGRYFYGVRSIALEMLMGLKNPFVVFVCGDVGKCVIVPADVIFDSRKYLSIDTGGSYKILLDPQHGAILGKSNRILGGCKLIKGQFQPFNYNDYIDRWDLLT